MNNNIETAKSNFFAICYDCLYYGYGKKFIFGYYTEIIDTIGKEEAKTIYNRAFEKICSE